MKFRIIASPATTFLRKEIEKRSSGSLATADARICFTFILDLCLQWGDRLNFFGRIIAFRKRVFLRLDSSVSLAVALA